VDVDFLQPISIEEALDLLAHHGDDAKVIGGGTAMALLLRNRLISPSVLVSLDRVAVLAGIASEDGSLRIGATTTIAEVAAAPEVRAAHPALALAYSVVGNVRVRNQATAGGNLAEADYASDPPTMLAALDATVTAASMRGTREIPVRALLVSAFTTSLEPDELIIAVNVPRAPSDARTAYRKFISRSSEDRACLGVGVLAVMDGAACQELRVAVGATCESPTRLGHAEAMATGNALTDETIGGIAEAYAAGVDVLQDLRGSEWYRRKVLAVEVRRALEEVRDGGR
jgi:carbon-monoxide dehydrogenase medium subunit